MPKKNDEIFLAIGELKGTLEQMDDKIGQRFEDLVARVDGHFKRVNGSLENHEGRIRKNEHYITNQKGKVAIIGGSVSFVAIAIWEFIKAKTLGQ